MEAFGSVGRNGLEVAKRNKTTVVSRTMERQHHLNRVLKKCHSQEWVGFHSSKRTVGLFREEGVWVTGFAEN